MFATNNWDTKRARKNKNSSSSLYWRLVEGQNCILLEACGSTCKKSKLIWEIKMCYFPVLFFTVYVHKFPKTMITIFFYKLSMNNRGWSWALRVDSVWLISECPHRTQLRNLIVHKNAKLWWNCTRTSRIAFVFTQRHALPSWQ